MPRKLRLEYPAAMYHVMSRGDQRDDIFLGEVDRRDFLRTLAEACQKTGWQVHVAWLQSTYTIRLSNPHKLTGHVLSDRYKAQLVEGSSNGYLRTAPISTQCVRNCSRQRFNASTSQSKLTAS